MRLLAIILFPLLCGIVSGAPKQVRVFIALCDNKTQGIVPVGAKIGNGDDPDANLYWGCSDGFGAYFRKSPKWKVLEKENDFSPMILRRMKLRHADGDVEILAEAYRGSAIRQCVIDFEAAACGDNYDLVAFIGHNGLMDFQLPPPKAKPGNDTDVIVLCCLSEKYFGDRLRPAGCRPVLMTRQFMYPGSFLLDAAIQPWKTGGSVPDIRNAAGRAYAKNQKIGVKAATGVFSNLK